MQLLKSRDTVTRDIVTRDDTDVTEEETDYFNRRSTAYVISVLVVTHYFVVLLYCYHGNHIESTVTNSTTLRVPLSW